MRIHPLSLLLACSLATPLLAQEDAVRIPGLRSLTVTGEYRLRYENFYNYDFNSDAGDDRDFVGQRFRLGFDAEVNDNLSAFVIFQDVRFWGMETSTTDGSADMFDVREARLTWRNTPLGGTATIGRQRLIFGDERLVGQLEWQHQGRAFDGVRHTWEEEDSHQVDVFVTQVAELGRPTAPGGPGYSDSRFLGVHGSLNKWDDTELDLYWLFLHDEETAAGGNEARSTVGVRFVQQAGALEFGTEVAAQFGEENNADADFGDVYALHAHLKWTFDGSTRPYARAEVNYATGDDPNTSGNERFKNLFPTAHGIWGHMDFMFWENVLHGTVEFGMQPDTNSKLSVAFLLKPKS